MARRVKPTLKQRKAARELIRNGKSPAESLRCAGFSPKQARKGAGEFVKRTGLRKAMNYEYKAFLRKCKDLPDFKEQELMINHRLVQNVINGNDAGVQSAKLLGSHRSIRMFEPDTAVSIHIDRAMLDELEDDSLIRTQIGAK